MTTWTKNRKKTTRVNIIKKNPHVVDEYFEKRVK